MPASPGDLRLDHGLALRANPCRYNGERCRAAGCDAVEVRLLMRRTVLMTGPQAAELFYDPARFVRAGAAPETLRATLFGEGAVQSLDGDAHAARKGLFLRALAPGEVERLVSISRNSLVAESRDWIGRASVPLHEAMQRVLTRAVCDWAGFALPPDAVDLRAGQLASLYDDAMSVRHLRARRARREAERWLQAEVEALRAGRFGAGPATVLQAVATHRDAGGRPLPARVAATELLNLLRPTVAVAVWVVFAAHALHRHQAWRDALRAQPGLLDCFVQEVRRFYPFFPMIAARVREPFEWQGVRFVRGRRALLDLYGTDRDPRCWESPERFRPERFRPERFLQRRPGPFEFVPQGGGDPATGHRCPGEAVAVGITREATRWLLEGLRYDVPGQDTELDMRRLPALPRDGFRIANVRPS